MWDYKEKNKKVIIDFYFKNLNLFMVRNVNNLEEERLISPELTDLNEERLENSLRPKTLNEYIGQDKVKENMKVYIEAAKKRGEALDHVLLYGPPGLGKTTLANIISNEMNSNIKITSGPAITKPRRFSSTTY